MGIPQETCIKRQTIKCVVWDLDNTLWNGTLLEDPAVSLSMEVLDVIKVLDGRGILHSIASKNDHDLAIFQLSAFGISDFFLAPQINWDNKSASLQEIARQLNLSLDTFAFVDDQIFEREEVKFSFPEILCIDARDICTIPDMPEMMPRFITSDSQRRREMYLSEFKRKDAEKKFIGENVKFMATLDMVFTIQQACEEDLKRAEELTIRTHQLNATGYTYSYEELDAFRCSSNHLLLIAGLEDKYGSYGKIGLALIERGERRWLIKLLLMSCRVISRGVGTILLNAIIGLCQQEDALLQAEFVMNERNRMMLITYSFAGFKQIRQDGAYLLLEHDQITQQPFPSYIRVELDNQVQNQT